jgi:SSS family solute:Na+ symporter
MEGIDWFVVVGYMLFVLFIGFRYRSQAGKSMADFFLGGRNLPWYVAGISMVATTFAADTPLWVTEKIAQHGISGNWLWWNMLIGGMLTTFFFSNLWRRANILTELELIEFRYSGTPAKILRAFKSIYMGIFLNAIIIGWVNAALMMILGVFFDIPDEQLIWYVGGAMFMVAAYSALSGLKGVVITDVVQFFIAMTGCIVLAIFLLNSEKIGGISGLKAQLPAWRFDFFPKITEESSGLDVAKTYSVSFGAFLTFGLVQWWASWYPGAEPGGGGYVAQRIMSTKNEKHAVYATLFFQVAHYCLRPWPWIIVGLCALVLYPDLPLDESGKGFVLAMKEYLPAGLKGLLFIAFLSAYMSTISTQLNWGASYLTNDLYKRFIKPENHFKDVKSAEKRYVFIGRISTLFIMLVALIATTQIRTIDSAAKFLIECGAGLGMVLILRWYWWRINAWSEISASIAPFFGYGIGQALDLAFPDSFLFTVGFSTVIWLSVTYLTPKTDWAALQRFYKQVRPQGNWKPFSDNNKNSRLHLLKLTGCWLSALSMTYSALFSIGYFIFQEWHLGINYFGIGIFSLLCLRALMRKTKIFE